MLILYLSLVASCFALFFALVLWIKTSPLKHANNVLSLVLLVLAVHNVLDAFLYYAHHQAEHWLPHHWPLNNFLRMLVGPLFFWYVYVLLYGAKPVPQRMLVLHALPIVPALAHVVWFALLPTTERVHQLQTNFTMHHRTDIALQALFYIQSVAYFAAGVWHLERRHKESPTLQTPLGTVPIAWLRPFVRSVLLLQVLSLVVCATQLNGRTNMLCTMISVDIEILGLLFATVWRYGLVVQPVVTSAPKPPRKELIGPELVQTYTHQLMNMLEIDRPYLDPTLTLDKLADSSGISRHHLSYLINNVLNKGFGEFINEYRVKHSCQLMDDGFLEKQKMAALAKVSGFNSYTSFYRAFETYTQMKPLEYKKKIEKNR